MADTVYCLSRKFGFENSLFPVQAVLEDRYKSFGSDPDLNAFVNELENQEDFFRVWELRKVYPNWIPFDRSKDGYCQLLVNSIGEQVIRTALIDDSDKSITLQFFVLDGLYENFLEMFVEKYYISETSDKDILDILDRLPVDKLQRAFTTTS